MNEEAKINMGKIAALKTMRNKVLELSRFLKNWVSRFLLTLLYCLQSMKPINVFIPAVDAHRTQCLCATVRNLLWLCCICIPQKPLPVTG